MQDFYAIIFNFSILTPNQIDYISPKRHFLSAVNEHAFLLNHQQILQ